MAEKSRLDIVPPKPPRVKRCETCACWEGPGPREVSGQCHANYPAAVPVPAANGQIGAFSLFPPMRAEQWCRKWEDASQEFVEVMDVTTNQQLLTK
jgi:hypothetical protein